MITYFKAIPLWKTHAGFQGDDYIIYQKFETIQDAIFAAKQDGTALRPACYEYMTGWEFSKYSWFGMLKTAIPLESLVNSGLLSSKITEDRHGRIFHFKDNNE